MLSMTPGRAESPSGHRLSLVSSHFTLRPFPLSPARLAPRPRSGFSVERSESFSSAGEDEEEDEDQFEILTAESLFTTLLDRVRNLTRRVSTEDSPLKVGSGRVWPVGQEVVVVVAQCGVDVLEMACFS